VTLIFFLKQDRARRQQRPRFFDRFAPARDPMPRLREDQVPGDCLVGEKVLRAASTPAAPRKGGGKPDDVQG